jgi:hypothetical protein
VVFEKLADAKSARSAQASGARQPSQSRSNTDTGSFSQETSKGVQDWESDPADSEDDDSDPASSEDEPTPKRARKAPGGSSARTHSSPRVRFAVHGEEEEQSFADGGYPAAQKLKAITPRGQAPLSAAASFFQEQRLCDAAQVDRVDINAVAQSDVVRLQTRYGMALDRLEALPHIGSFLPVVKPASLEAVAVLAEEVLDRLLRANSAPAAGQQTGGGDVQVLPQVDADDEDKSGKRSEGLEGAKLRKSIPFAVASNLQSAQVQLTLANTKAGGDVAAGIRHAPEGLRADLQRAVMSKCCVHGPGMLLSQLWIPPTVHHWKVKTEYLVAQELRTIANGDQTQRWKLDSMTARKLAACITEGDISLSDLIKTNKEMRGDSAPTAGSLEELNQAWRLAELGFSKLSEVVGGQRDSGLRMVTETLDSSARSQQLSPKDCKEWLHLVLSSYEEALAEFRCGDITSLPSFTRAVEQNARHMTFSCFVAAAAKALPLFTPKKDAGLKPGDPPDIKKTRRQQGKEHQQERLRLAREKAAAKEEEKQPIKQVPKIKTKPKSEAWPDRPDFQGKRWHQLVTDTRKEFPQTCSFHLLTGCDKDEANCSFAHKVPDGFAAFKASNAT